MSDSDSPMQRQQAEYELLKEIYYEGVQRNDDNEWLDVSIALSPLHDSRNPDIHARISLNVICDDLYPDTVPQISLSQSKGLSKVQIDALLQKLNERAKELVGEVMILQLAEIVREYLHEHNKPGTQSFYEEMVKRNSMMEKQRNQLEEDKKWKDWLDIREKVGMKEACIEYSSHSSDESDETSSSGEEEDERGKDRERKQKRVRFMSFQHNSQSEACDHRTSKYVQFGNKVIRGACMEHEEHSVKYFGIDVSTGEPCVIQEYILKPQEKQTSKELLSNVLKQLDSIEAELQYFKQFINKPENIVAYVDFKHIIERDHLVMYIVQEYASNISLTKLPKFRLWEIETDYAFLRYVVVGVLSALLFLHANNVIHRNVKASSVYLSEKGAVMLADYSVAKRMEDLKMSCLQINTSGTRSRISRASDVLQLAKMVLGLLRVPADLENRPDVPDTVPASLRDFIDKCYLDEDRRWTVRQLLSHDFVRPSFPNEPSGRTRRRPSTSRSHALLPAGNGDDTEEEEKRILSQLQIPSNLKGQSRLSSEFRVLRFLGSGSFGKVLKAKNLLDGGIYAIKAIELNPRNEQLNRKMIREVKLLSKLNHENVVRYYNSWIETTNVDNSSSVTQVTSTPLQSLTDIKTKREMTGLSHNGNPAEEEEGDDEDDDDDEEDSSDEEENQSHESDSEFRAGLNGLRINNENNEEPSESIMFVDSGAGGDAVDSALGEDSPDNSESVKQLRNLYIQMEFCEKSTLRIAIDKDRLCDNLSRFWRLVREAIEGLAYIHQQDMIHRDLKPVNIFLDSHDHVKIGDFGLATTSVLKNNFIMTMSGAESENSSHLHTDESHTGGVGTSFYVAPELQKQGGKAHYNKKVDIYSFGIILFEMAHPPFTTNMERCKTLSNLRLPEIVAPEEMSTRNPVTMNLVRQLLNHDPNKRPTCSEILAGSILPPPEVEDSELQDFIRHTLSNPQSKAYKYLISSCFLQRPFVEDDLTYHTDIVASDRFYALRETVRDAVVQVMRRHGARCVPTPLLLPQTDHYEASDTCVRLMTHSGSVVMIPRDLRIPLARFVAQKGTTHLRRYCVERVYRERRTHGYHPRESLDCAFDIITPTPGEFTSDAEVISVFQDIMNELPALNSRNYVVRINHTLLLEAVLLSWGLEKLYKSVFDVLREATEFKHSKLRLTTNLESVGVSNQHSVHLVDLFTKEEQLSKISNDIIPVVKRKDAAFVKAKKGLEQLKTIVGHAEAMGNKIPVAVCPGVVHTSSRCTGIMFDLCIYGPAKKRNKETVEILASGCRYDGLVEDFRNLFAMTLAAPDDIRQSAVGVSVALDKLVKVVKDDEESLSGTRVVICSLGQDSLMTRTKAELVRSFRSAGVTSYVLENVLRVDDVETYSRDNQVSHIVWLKESERGTARVRIWDAERDRYVEKKLPLTDVVASVSKSARPAADVDVVARPVVSDAVAAQAVNINIIAEEKMQANNRRRYETQIKSKIASFLSNFSSRPTIEILGLFLESKIVKAIAAHLNVADDASDFAANAKSILDMFPRHKKYLAKICDKVYSYCSSSKDNVVVIIYSLNDDKFRQVI